MIFIFIIIVCLLLAGCLDWFVRLGYCCVEVGESLELTVEVRTSLKLLFLLLGVFLCHFLLLNCLLTCFVVM